MAVRHPRLRGARALGVAAVAAAALLTGTLADRVSRAQPAPELARAKELYQLAERAMKDGRFDDAARDYGASYELSKDPALFFKIGRANEGAGRCNVALTYYARYLRDGKPTEQFAATTRERMRACGGDPASGAPSGDRRPGSAAERGSTGSGARPAGSASASGDRRSGSAADTASAGSGARPGGSASASGDRRPAGATETGGAGNGARPGATASASVDRGPGSAAESGNAGSSARPGGVGVSDVNRGSVQGAGSDAGALGAAGSVGGGSGEAAPPPLRLVPTNRHKVAWVLTGSAIALTALGGILAAAASSSENDIRDLYVGFAGQPPTFNAETRKRYDDLVDEGHRFQHLSWASFGLAGAAAAGAAILFVLGGRDESAPHARITPVVTPKGAGVAIGF